MADDDEAPTAKELQAEEFAAERVDKIVAAVGGDMHAVRLRDEIRDAFLAGHLISVMERLPDITEIEDDDIKRDLAICAAATKGPWHADQDGDNPDQLLDTQEDWVIGAAPCGYMNSNLCISEEDIAFICAARERWEPALREVIRLRAERDEARRLAAAAVHGYDAWQASNEDDACAQLDAAIAAIRSKGMP